MTRILLIISLLGLLAPFGKSQEIKVMTYNIRFDNPGDGLNAWPNRRDFWVSQVRFHHPLVLGVQEALKHQLDEIDKAFPEYQYIGVGRDDGGDTGEFSAIFYDSTKLRLLNQGTFWLSPTPAVPSKGWDAALNRICTFGLFQPRAGAPFWVFNTHFDHVGTHARVASAQLILDQIEEKNSDNYPIILMGDLNLTPDTPPIQLLAKTLRDTYTTAAYPPLGPAGTFTGFSWEAIVDRRIDYIFVSEQIATLKTAILTDSRDKRYPSDHFPVIAHLRLE